MPKTFADLVALMDRLRSPDGCPWDREQTYATLAPMLLEEAYEAFDALEEAREGRPAALREELGDLLFQITFFAQVANERGEFNIDDVIDEVHTKMVRRHPHVFSDTKASDSAEVLRNWEAIKAEEKRTAAAGSGKSENVSILDGVSTKAPALMEAHQISTSGARGFRLDPAQGHFCKATGRGRRIARSDWPSRRHEFRGRPRPRPGRDRGSAFRHHQHRAALER
jgi:ATP diphosphatase